MFGVELVLVMSLVEKMNSLPVEKSESENWIFYLLTSHKYAENNFVYPLTNLRAKTEPFHSWKIWEKSLNLLSIEKSDRFFLPIVKSDSKKLNLLPVEKSERKLNLPDGGKLLPRSTESTDQRLKTLPPLPGLAWAHLAQGVLEVKLSRKRVS